MESKWESICSRCGLCCYERILLSDMLFVNLDKPCKHYDEKNRCCRIYSERLERAEDCNRVTLLTAMLSTGMPSTCAYIKWAEAHHIRLRKSKELVFGTPPFYEG